MSGDQHASLRGLISTWLEIAVNAMLSLSQSDGRRIWVILDEFPTLHQVPSLQPGLAESRQFGGCFVLGVQVASALRDLYGRNGAETISGLCGTRVVLAAPDRDTAQWSADSLGRSEIEEVAKGYSHGANTIRDGVSLTPRRELRSLALPSEIMRLPNLHGYLKFPGPLPVASIRLKYVNRPASAERFVPREADTGEAEAGGDASGEAAPPPEVPPEEPEGWFGQGELDLFGESDGAREGAVESGPPPASGADGEGEETVWPTQPPADGEAGTPDVGPATDGGGSGAAAPAGDPAADAKTTPALPPDRAPARPDAEVPGGLMRF